MPVFRLTEELVFPDPALSEPEGLLAVDGDLSAKRLLLAYASGIFPWYSEGYPILWWSPDPRLVLFPEELKISSSLRQTIKRGTFKITFDKAFERVIRSCAEVHAGEEGGTWITPEMEEAYIELHRLGYAHSAEAWRGKELAGGLYGVALGSAFAGESMFAMESDASKAAFAAHVQELKRQGFAFIDCQVKTAHLSRFGAREIPRDEFLKMLGGAIRKPAGTWGRPYEPLKGVC